MPRVMFDIDGTLVDSDGFDGEWDRQACARLGFDFVLVGARTRHPRAIADFLDPAPALAWIGLPGTCGNR